MALRGHLAQVKITNGGRSLRARCPVCDGDRRSLGISAVSNLRIVWQCFAGCDGNEVRRALRVAGIPPGCLPRGDGTEHSRTDIVAAILASGTRHDRAHTILRAYTVLRGHTRWPRGRELIATVQRPAHGRSSALPGAALVARQKCSGLHFWKCSGLHLCGGLHVPASATRHRDLRALDESPSRGRRTGS